MNLSIFFFFLGTQCSNQHENEPKNIKQYASASVKNVLLFLAVLLYFVLAAIHLFDLGHEENMNYSQLKLRTN